MGATFNTTKQRAGKRGKGNVNVACCKTVASLHGLYVACKEIGKLEGNRDKINLKKFARTVLKEVTVGLAL